MNRNLIYLTLLVCLGLHLGAAVPPPEQLLPSDTLGLVTVPDWTKAAAAYRETPYRQLWNDTALQPFKDKFLNKLKQDVIAPLEQQLGIKFTNYSQLAQGQLTIAVVQNGWEGKEGQLPAWLLLLDARDKSDQLKKQLADLKQKWTEAGKQLKIEKIRDIEFTTLIVDTDEVAKTLEKSLSNKKSDKEAEKKSDDKKAQPKFELTVGQSESLLIIGNAPKVIEKILSRQSGGLVPSLGEQANYQANHQAQFRDALAYGWIHSKPLIEIATRLANEAVPPSKDQNSLTPQPGKIITASGLGHLRTVAFSLKESSEGSMMNFSLGVPEANRQGIFKMITPEAKESSPPPFVPADVVKFMRWRLDGKKIWASLETMLNEISPQLGGFLQMSLGAVGKDKDPNYDFKKSLIGNLGDDMISFQKAPRGATLAELNSPPALFLLGSPNAEQFTLAVKAGAALMPSGSAVKEREFLGRKIYSFPLAPVPNPAGGKPMERTFSFAASGGYVAMSSDAAILEEFLRSKEVTGKTLRETSGLNEAAQKVGGMNTGLFGYENQSETLRVTLETLRSNPDTLLNMLSQAPGLPPRKEGDKGMKDWLDFSLLPSYEKIAKYFHYSVYAGSANSDAISYKWFSPVPPQMKQ